MLITQALAAQLPWVLLMAESQPCSGYRYTAMTARTFRETASHEQYRCRNRARWRFSSLKGETIRAPDGTYCWSHLLTDGLYFSRAEEARTEKALKELAELPGP